jgi:hypothetical protein
MRDPHDLQQVYENLAKHFATRGEPRPRDQCLVLAADAALTAGNPDAAERVRQRLLQVNPHHMLRPFASMQEALQSRDVQDYIADLRVQWPPEQADRLLEGGTAPAEPSATYKLASAPAKPAPVAPSKPVAAPVRKPTPSVVTPGQNRQTVSPTAAVPAPRRPAATPLPAARFAATLLFLLGVAAGGAVVFFAMVRPLLER